MSDESVEGRGASGAFGRGRGRRAARAALAHICVARRGSARSRSNIKCCGSQHTSSSSSWLVQTAVSSHAARTTHTEAHAARTSPRAPLSPSRSRSRVRSRPPRAAPWPWAWPLLPPLASCTPYPRARPGATPGTDQTDHTHATVHVYGIVIELMRAQSTTSSQITSLISSKRTRRHAGTALTPICAS